MRRVRGRAFGRLSAVLMLLSLWTSGAQGALEAGAVLGASGDGFERALAPRTFQFPEDHGVKPDFRTQWWYLTAHLKDGQGQPFGVQFTLFRQGLLAPARAPDRPSPLASNALWMAHLAITTPEGHGAEERFARDALGLAGVTPTPFRAWLEDWTLEAAPGAGSAPFPATLSAIVEIGGQRQQLTLTLGAPRGPVLQGDGGLSLKSRETGSASYYYSYTRMAASLTLTSRDGDSAPRRASGLAWFDREWSSGALAPEQVGWDWLALHLASGHDLMLFRLRRADGSVSGVQEGTLVAPDGQSTRLSPGAYRFEPVPGATWEGPRGGRWPVRWRLTLPALGVDDVVSAVRADQHNPLTVPYWEGMVCFEGDGESCGYLEMTGYEPPTDAGPRSVE